MTAPRDREAFVAATVEWLNRKLMPQGSVVSGSTPLFVGGLIDSLRVLELIAWTEWAIGAEIPDRMIRMDNFQTVGRIADVFFESSHALFNRCGRAASYGRARRAWWGCAAMRLRCTGRWNARSRTSHAGKRKRSGGCQPASPSGRWRRPTTSRPSRSG